MENCNHMIYTSSSCILCNKQFWSVWKKELEKSLAESFQHKTTRPIICFFTQSLHLAHYEATMKINYFGDSVRMSIRGFITYNRRCFTYNIIRMFVICLTDPPTFLPIPSNLTQILSSDVYMSETEGGAIGRIVITTFKSFFHAAVVIFAFAGK